jgi:hypothetical protein
MDISLTWQDLVKIANTGKVEKGDITVMIPRPMLPTITISPDGKTGSVLFTVDESDPHAHQAD